MKFFGDPKFRKEYETHVETPTGVPCLYCDEPIAADDIGILYGDNRPLHHECELRMGVGSVGHQRKRCFCYGGSEEDPPGSTRREGAIAAARYFYKDQ